MLNVTLTEQKRVNKCNIHTYILLFKEHFKITNHKVAPSLNQESEAFWIHEEQADMSIIFFF